MDDFSLYQWLVLALLSVIVLMIWAAGTSIERNLERNTERLESALAELRDEQDSEHLAEF